MAVQGYYLRHKHNITSQQPIGHIWNFNQDMIFNLKKKSSLKIFYYRQTKHMIIIMFSLLNAKCSVLNNKVQNYLMHITLSLYLR